MSNFKLNLPTDIPWRRKCVSEDMLDPKLCDARAPLHWRSSIAVFEYEPDKENQNYDGFIISYLKVSCSITGYQEHPDEIGLDYHGIKSYWKDQPGIKDYVDSLEKYYACYGAVLEVTVGPGDQDRPLGEYPFYLDFEPKKRELYELATDTKEKQSRSIESLNLTKSAGTTQSLETFDVDMGGGGFGVSAQYAGTGGSFNYAAPNGQWGSKRMNAEESLSSRSADVGEEKRDTYSFSTQLSQLYHQLDSYHLGTNRALFFVLPRPHTLETEHTFVNGLRNIEGMQEFFLVVARPKNVESVCVEAYLETGHIGKETHTEASEVLGSEKKTVWTDNFHAEPRGNDDETEVVDSADRIWEVNNFFPGYIIKNAVLTAGPPIVDVNESDAPNLIDDVPHITMFNQDLIKVAGRVHSWFENVDFGKDNIGKVTYPFAVDITLAKTELVEKSKDTLFITARNLCCCQIEDRIQINKTGVVYERPLKEVPPLKHRQSVKDGLPIIVANQMHAQLKEPMITSRNDLQNRYNTPIRLAETTFANQLLIRHLDGSRPIHLKDLRNLPRTTRQKLSTLNQDVTLQEILSMPFQMQKDIFSMTDQQVVELRNSLTGLSHASDDPREAWLSKRQINRLFAKSAPEVPQSPEKPIKNSVSGKRTKSKKTES
jgi:hypothetical protein